MDQRRNHHRHRASVFALLFIWAATMNAVGLGYFWLPTSFGNWRGLHCTGHNNHAPGKPYAFRRRTYL